MSFLTEELAHRLNWMRDEQARTNANVESRIKSLEAENKDVRNRLMVLTRLLIAKQVASAEEIAMALAAISAPPPAAVAEESPPESSSP